MHVGDEMELEKIKELALANGFSLKEQASGNMDLHSYVYEFANALLREATPEGSVLDAPARVGGGIFRKGVKWKTVVESAQRLYEHSKDEIKPIVSPADMLKIASGELVLVPSGVLDLTRFMCETWTEIDKFVYKNCQNLELYPLIQGSKTQSTIRKIGKQKFNPFAVGAGIQAIIEAQEQSHDNSN